MFWRVTKKKIEGESRLEKEGKVREKVWHQRKKVNQSQQHARVDSCDIGEKTELTSECITPPPSKLFSERQTHEEEASTKVSPMKERREGRKT